MTMLPSLSFAGVKADRFQTARDSIIKAVANVYIAHSYLKNSLVLTKEERASFDAFQNYSIQPAPKSEIPDALLAASLNTLSMYLERHHDEKKYDAILIAKGISKDRIRHYGFAFEGKKVLIG